MKKQISTTRFSAALLALATLLAHGLLQAAEGGGTATDQAEHANAKVIQAKGIVQSINAAADTLTVAHEAIPEINWPAMNMQFKVLGNAEEQVEVGDTVNFELTREGANYTITKIEKSE